MFITLQGNNAAATIRQYRNCPTAGFENAEVAAKIEDGTAAPDKRSFRRTRRKSRTGFLMAASELPTLDRENRPAW
jgi:hypothetical protein